LIANVTAERGCAAAAGGDLLAGCFGIAETDIQDAD